MANKVKTTRVKKGTPSLSWTIEQIETWWKKHGLTYLDEEEFWDGKLARYVCKKANELVCIGDFDEFNEHSEAFPGCCAFDVLYTLDWHLEGDFEGPLSFEQRCAVVSWQLRKGGGHSLLSTARQPGEEKILDAIGAIRLTTVVNPNTSNKVTLWLVTIK